MTAGTHAQNYQISFTGTGLSSNVDSVQVLNLVRGTSVTVKSTEGLQLVTATTDIENHLTGDDNLRIFPNPMTELSGIEFFNFRESLVNIEIYDVTGRIVIRSKQHVLQGHHRFEISGLNTGIYMVNLHASDGKYFGKLLSNGEPSGTPAIRYQGNAYLSAPKSLLKSAQNLVQMDYSAGERLLLKGISGNNSRVLTLIPSQVQTVNFEFIACTDAAGKHYPVVSIGNQTWMAENLAYLPIVGPSYQGSDTILNYYVYGYQGINVSAAKATSNYKTYGVLYNWLAAMDACPVGWHLPTDEEWKSLEMHLGMTQSEADISGWRGTNEGSKLKETGTKHWISKYTVATNESGFTALPGGLRSASGSFFTMGDLGYWWSATEESPIYICYRSVFYEYSNVNRNYYNKSFGFSVRCLKD